MRSRITPRITNAVQKINGIQSRNFPCVREKLRDRTRRVTLSLFRITNLLFPVQCLSPRIFADVRNSKKHWPSFLVCFSYVLDRDEKRWRAEERFRNSDMHSLHPHIRWCFFVRRSTIFDGARWTDGDFRLLFMLTRVRLFTFSIGFL